MNPSELLGLLQEFHRDTLDLINARQARSRSITGYDANNVYQQVLGRQDVHLSWVADAISALGGEAAHRPEGSHESTDAAASVRADVQAQQAFIDRWTPQVERVTNARHRRLLELVLGEMKEHLRALQQAADGRSDVLGPHADGKVLRGAVLPVRPKN